MSGQPLGGHAALEAAGVELRECADNWTALASDVMHGLLDMPKTLPAKWFYDPCGSRLFDKITDLDEYYLTRRERALLSQVAGQIVSEVAPVELIELGAGSSTKTPLLLDAIAATGRLERYVPVDVSASAMEEAAPRLLDLYPGLEISACICDFTRRIPALSTPSTGPRLLAFLGSTIGNLQPVEVRAFLGSLREGMRPGDALLLGTDLVKDVAVLEAAYDDPGGVTAEFNLNVLEVINRELKADFDVASFQHEASYNRSLDRMEMRLRSREPQVVRIEALGIEVTFLEGESILTEISRKFTRATVEQSYTGGGLKPGAWFEDADGWYALSLASA